MREAEFKTWLGQRLYKGKPLSTVNERLHWCRAVEKALPTLGFAERDLDTVHTAGRWDALLDATAKLRSNWRNNEAAARVIAPKSAEPRGQMANARQSIGLYGRFANGDDPNYDAGADELDLAEKGSGLDRASIEAAMDEFDALGAAAFYAKYERGAQGVRYYVVRATTRYPSKAIANAAYEVRHGERDHYGGTGARKALEACGYVIVESGSSDAAVTIFPSALSRPTNLILYGPPGTGKTYATARKAVELCGEVAPNDRDELMERYRALVEARRIDFVTFHQSYSYEDFVEGLRPNQGSVETNGESAPSSGFSLLPEDGVFRRIARRAAASKGGHGQFVVGKRQVFKLSIGEAAKSEDDYLFEEALLQGHGLLGYDDIDWSDAKFADRDAIIAACREYDLSYPETDAPQPTAYTGRVQCPLIFRNWISNGDLIIVSKGNSKFRAIGEVTGNYDYVPRESGSYSHRRRVNWLWIDRAGAPVDDIYAKNFTMRPVYLLTPAELNTRALESYINSQNTESGMAYPEAFVIIIDEINRGNVSKIFGELIALIEVDKRAGMTNALEVRLPYSREPFSVPANLHIIGTMNTADRSIALLDTALRRRFAFEELMPVPDLLGIVDGIDLPVLLRTVNERVEYLFDREHQIGHAYFMGCASRADVDAVMRHKVIPLLAEYFYEDWGKVARVLGDAGDGINGFLTRKALAAPPELGDDYEDATRYRWSVRDSFDYDAFAGG